jgi:hypothetical protein
MRAFVLKREVPRSGLVTEEESGAYRDTLHLLAGQTALVRPWSRTTSDPPDGRSNGTRG